MACPLVHSCKNSYKKCLEPVSFKAENIKPKAQFLCHMEGMGVGGTQKPWNDSSFQGTFNQPQKAHKRVHVIVPSSFIQTVLSASEFHRIMPYGSWAVPPVGNRTLP
jgi:hypothetical protein